MSRVPPKEDSQPNSPNPNKPKPKTNNTQDHEENPWVETAKTLTLSVLLAFGIRTFVAEARYIPSGSMQPTLQINDRLLVDKITYNFQTPQRGDIVVFEPTNKLEEKHYHDAFIKRIIGLPGDTIKIEDGQVYVNGKALDEDYIANEPLYHYPKTTVPENSYFVLGDNRNNSYDSHYWGFVPRDKIIGRAVIRFWPPNRIGEIEGEVE